jgi:hypothetical protein
LSWGSVPKREKRRGLVLTCSLLALCLDAEAVLPDPLSGGFSLTPLFPILQGLAPYPKAASALPVPGRYSLASALVLANTFRYDDGSRTPYYSVILDGESLVQRVELRAGIGEGLALESWIEWTRLGAGGLDGVLSAFHRAFGFPNMARDLFPDNRLEMLVVTPSGTFMDVSSEGTAFTSAGFGLEFAPFSPGRQPGLLAAVRVKVPTVAAPPWLLSERLALEASLGWAGRVEFFEASLSVGLAWQDPFPERAGLAAQAWLLQGGASLFFHLNPDLKIGVEAAASSSPYGTVERYLGSASGNLWIGGKARLDEAWSFEAALIEELLSWASIEVGFQAGLTYCQ